MKNFTMLAVLAFFASAAQADYHVTCKRKNNAWENVAFSAPAGDIDYQARLACQETLPKGNYSEAWSGVYIIAQHK